MLPGLKALRNDSMGVPAVFCDFESDDYTLAASEKNYHDILDKMIFSFEQTAKYCWQDELRAEYFDENDNPLEGDFQTASDRYQAAEEEHRAAILEGRELFAKYFEHLYD